MKKRRWSSKPPKKQGWYYWRRGNCEGIAKLFWFAGYILFSDGEHALPVDDMKDTQWKLRSLRNRWRR